MPAAARVTIMAAVLCAALAACSSTQASSDPPHTPRATATPFVVPTPMTRLALVDIPVAGQPPVAGTPWFLAIGDSITFGFTVDPARAGSNSSWALQLQGLLAASGRPWKLYDTACNAENTRTYYTRCLGRSTVPFLINQSQHDAALKAVRTHRRDLRAIFVALGSTDLLGDERVSISLDTTVSSLRATLAAIVTELQGVAPGVPVIICNFYDPIANLLPASRDQVAVVNTMLAALAQELDVRLADFHGAINSPAAGRDEQLCSWIDCADGDIHPTVAGQARLARAALAALDSG